MSTEILETSPLYQEWIAKGRAEGRQEGRQEGLHDAIITLLRGRFGEPAPEVMAALARVPVGELPEIVALAATGTLDEVRARLGV